MHSIFLSQTTNHPLVSKPIDQVPDLYKPTTVLLLTVISLTIKIKWRTFFYKNALNIFFFWNDYMYLFGIVSANWGNSNWNWDFRLLMAHMQIGMRWYSLYICKYTLERTIYWNKLATGNRALIYDDYYNYNAFPLYIFYGLAINLAFGN